MVIPVSSENQLLSTRSLVSEPISLKLGREGIQNMGNKSHSEKIEKNVALCVFRLVSRLGSGEKRKNPNVICRGAFCSTYELFTVVFGSLIEAPVDQKVIKGEERDFIFLSFLENHSTTARRCVLGSRVPLFPRLVKAKICL